MSDMRLMRCARYHANIPVSTCLARRRRAMHSLTRWTRWWHSAASFDPGCARCEQGASAEAEAARKNWRKDP